MQTVHELLDAARASESTMDSATALHLDDPEQVRALARRMLERVETVDRVVRILAAEVEELAARAEPSDSLFI